MVDLVHKMPQTKLAERLLDILDTVHYIDSPDILNAAEGIARREGSPLVRANHVGQALAQLSDSQYLDLLRCAAGGDGNGKEQ